MKKKIAYKNPNNRNRKLNHIINEASSNKTVLFLKASLDESSMCLLQQYLARGNPQYFFSSSYFLLALIIFYFTLMVTKIKRMVASKRNLDNEGNCYKKHHCYLISNDVIKISYQ